MLFHNESEVWKPVHAGVDAGDAAADGRAIRLMVAVGALLPEHYLAERGNMNRAMAPLEQVAGAVERLSSALAVASERGWVTEEEARRLWWRFARQVDESAPQGNEG